MRYWIEEHYWMITPDKEAQRLREAFPVWTGTNAITEGLDDFDLASTGSRDGRDIHSFHFRCSVDHVPNMHDTHADIPFNRWAAGLGPAMQEVHHVVTSFFSGHDTGTWEVTKGFTTVSSDDLDTIEDTHDGHLVMTLHHTEEDLSQLYRSPHEAVWFSRYGRL